MKTAGLSGILRPVMERRRLIRYFQKTAALNPSLARSPRPETPASRVALRYLSRRGILHKITGENSYYLDERKLMEYRMGRVKWAMIFLFLFVGMLFLLIFRPGAF